MVMAGEILEGTSALTQHGYTTIAEVLTIVHFYDAWVLFLVFIVAFVTNSILSAEEEAEGEQKVLLGPGGKPLPMSAGRKAKEERAKRKKLEEFSPVRKLVFLYLSVALLLTYITNGAAITLHVLTNDGPWWCGKSEAIYILASAFFYSIFLVSLFDTSPSPNISHQITWVVATIGEIIILGATIALYTAPHKESNATLSEPQELRRFPTTWEVVDITIDTVRLIILLFLVTFYLIFSLERLYTRRSDERRELDEASPLLMNGRANGNGHANGNGTVQNGGIEHASENDSQDGNTANSETAGRKSIEDPPAFYKPIIVPNRTWWEYLKGYAVFFPYLWPSDSMKLQVTVVICFLLVVMQRVINILVPIQVGVVTTKLENKEGETPGMPWVSIALMILFKLLQGSSGILGAARSVLWIPISQYSYQALTTASFEHVHGLSLDFHLGKRTGEVLSALSKGNAINTFLEQVTFSVLPMVFDLGVAVIYFGIVFDAYYALIVAIITVMYLYLTIRMARWRTDQRRLMTNLSREEDAVKNDSLTSYETVKYFNAEQYEFNRYRKAVSAFQKAEYGVTVSLNILNISQNMVFMTGLLFVSLISAYQVQSGQRDVGSFVSLLTYMTQLQQPLNFFGTFYRGMQSAMINGERLLELFKEQPTVVDKPTAKEMPGCEGQIRFQNVKFSYDERKPALEDLSFTCQPGTTTAFVGESGGGKSTVFRLLFRFYNAADGSIQLDGNDVKDITIDSLRQHIGTVPQDTVLFNETLMYNLRYANQNATDEQIFDACRAASIHDKIMAFPDGYNTKVGERGLRLSGGEKQRVAIARTIIKNPRIILLDEATAALDSETEQNIQEALQTLSKGRTMMVIAHRLSTITTADQILVLHAGKVAEKGTHAELVAMGGRYDKMWKKQVRATKAMEEATEAVAKAKALQEAVDKPGSINSQDGASGNVSDTEMEASQSTLINPKLATDALNRVSGDSAVSISDSDSGDEAKTPGVNDSLILPEASPFDRGSTRDSESSKDH